MILALLVPKAHFLQFPKPTYILVPKALFGNEGGVSITRRGLVTRAEIVF